jgi:hypothetical protein
MDMFLDDLYVRLRQLPLHSTHESSLATLQSRKMPQLHEPLGYIVREVIRAAAQRYPSVLSVLTYDRC